MEKVFHSSKVLIYWKKNQYRFMLTLQQLQYIKSGLYQSLTQALIYTPNYDQANFSLLCKSVNDEEVH